MRTPAVVAATLLLGAQALANDSAIKGVGGAIHLLDEHSSVRMVSEHVRIELPGGEVEATFVFYNDGPATTVLMGFPESGYNAGAIKTGFERFESRVDGKRISVERRVAEHTDEAEYKFWWVKKVPFKAGQTRTVVNRYRAQPGDSTDGVRNFRYVVVTGASWNGTIGKATFECDISGLRSASRLRVLPEGYRRAGDRLIWSRQNLEPTTQDDIRVSWFPGWLDISVNARSVMTQRDSVGKEYELSGWSYDWGQVFSWREGDEVWAPVRATAAWLGAKLTVVKFGRTVRLTLGERWVELTVGSRGARTNKGDLQLSHAVRMKRDHIIAPLTSVVKALGGSATWNRKTGFLDIKTPYPRDAGARCETRPPG